MGFLTIITKCYFHRKIYKKPEKDNSARNRITHLRLNRQICRSIDDFQNDRTLFFDDSERTRDTRFCYSAFGLLCLHKEESFHALQGINVDCPGKFWDIFVGGYAPFNYAVS